MSLYLWKMEQDRYFNEWARETFGVSSKDATPDNISLIERNHKCPKCDGDVRYVKKKDATDELDFEFVCKECGHACDDAPLKKDTK